MYITETTRTNITEYIELMTTKATGIMSRLNYRSRVVSLEQKQDMSSWSHFMVLLHVLDLVGLYS